MLSHHRGVRRLQLGARRSQGRARRQPPEELRHPMHAAGHHRRRQVMRTGDDVRDELGLRRIGTDGSSTPTMVADRCPSRTVLPSTDGSLLNAVVQKRWVSTAAPAAFGPSSARIEQAADHGRRPITSK